MESHAYNAALPSHDIAITRSKSASIQGCDPNVLMVRCALRDVEGRRGEDGNPRRKETHNRTRSTAIVNEGATKE